MAWNKFDYGYRADNGYSPNINSGQPTGDLFSKIGNQSLTGVDPHNTYRRYLDSAQQAYRQGLLGKTASQYTSDAIQTYGNAANQSNPLLQLGVDQAKQFITNPGANPYVQKAIGDFTNSTINAVTPSVQSQFALGGRSANSTAARGAIADRVTSQIAPYATQLLGQDFNNRQQLQADFTRNAATLGSAPLQYQAQRAGLQQQAGALQEAAPTPYDELARYQSLLGGANTYQERAPKPKIGSQLLGGALTLGGAFLSGGGKLGFGGLGKTAGGGTVNTSFIDNPNPADLASFFPTYSFGK